MKRFGVHHVPLGLLLAFLLGPLANLTFWFGKELGEATMRAGGTREAFKDWPSWEPWDAITPSVFGYLLSLTGFDIGYVLELI